MTLERRTFLKGSAAVAGGAALAGPFAGLVAEVEALAAAATADSTWRAHSAARGIGMSAPHGARSAMGWMAPGIIV